MKNLINKYIWILLGLINSSSVLAQVPDLIFDIEKPKKQIVIPQTLYGVFFEDINFGADGGLYAELLKNRSFEFKQNLMGWKTFGNVSLRNDGPFNNNPHYVHLAPTGNEWRQTGLQNEGFCGIGIHKDATYRFSVWARTTGNSEKETITIELGDLGEDTWGQAFCSAKITIDSPEWKKYTVELTSPKSSEKSFFRLFLESDGEIDLEHLSLFPKDTWKGRDNGLRKDLVQALYDLKPGVFRFPGGCIVEGTDLETRYQWKETIGPVENRPLNENRWQFTFKYRFFPDYYQTNGLGFYEYFLLAEDLKAEPLPVVNCGLICQYMAKHESEHAQIGELDSYIQDALDLIEFANGDTTSTWGKKRAELGHPQPFNLKYIGIGNEQWGKEYVDRLKLFVKAIRSAYPDIKIVGSSGPKPDGEEFEYLWPEMKKLKVDLVDEHFYKDENWFLKAADRYDSYDRKAPKVFAGEYACHASTYGRNHFQAALYEAAFMTGIERNADVVEMATYAPLFAHLEAWQWRPDLIWFNNLNVMRTSSFYVQQLFSHYKGTEVLKLTIDGVPVTGKEEQNGLYASAVWDEQNNCYIIKVVNISNNKQTIKLNFKKKALLGDFADATRITLAATNPRLENSITQPDAIMPKVESISLQNISSPTIESNANSLQIYILHIKH